MHSGTIHFADRVISFIVHDGEVTYTVCDTFTGKQEKHTVPMSVFASALALAVHPDGQPVSAVEQTKAEKHMQAVSDDLRWIP